MYQLQRKQVEKTKSDETKQESKTKNTECWGFEDAGCKQYFHESMLQLK